MKPLNQTILNRLARLGCAAAVILSSASPIAMAQEGDWEVRTDIQANYGSYSKSVLRDNISSAGMILTADYLEQSGFSLAANASKVQFKTAPAISQQSYFASGHLHSNIDGLPGTLSFRLDGHYISNNDISGNTDGVSVFAPQISFTDFEKSYYIDIGYARSSYKNQLTINQYTPTIGFGFNEQADWLQLRGYFISPSNAARAQNKSSTTAAEIKWSHWFAPDNMLKLHQMRLNVLAGERIYAVDGDAAAVYNLADVQRGSVSLGLQWRISDAAKWLLLAGQESFLDNTINNSYNSRFIYSDISITW